MTLRTTGHLGVLAESFLIDSFIIPIIPSRRSLFRTYCSQNDVQGARSNLSVSLSFARPTHPPWIQARMVDGTCTFRVSWDRTCEQGMGPTFMSDYFPLQRRRRNTRRRIHRCEWMRSSLEAFRSELVADDDGGGADDLSPRELCKLKESSFSLGD